MIIKSMKKCRQICPNPNSSSTGSRRNGDVGRGRPNTCSPNMSQILTMGKAWFSSSASGEFDRARRIGNCRRGRMLGGKASDTHVNVEPELKTWPRVSCRMEKIMRTDLAESHSHIEFYFCRRCTK
jgi:hypothetical protein